MAITNGGTRLTGTALEEAEATGYTNPAVTLVTNPLWIRARSFDIAKSSVENATESTTYENIRAACNTQAALDDNVFDATGNVTVHTDVTTIDVVVDDYGNAATVYRCQMNIYVNVA